VADAVRWKKKQPGITAALAQVLDQTTGGDPQRARKWSRRSLRWLSWQLREQGYQACPRTVGRLLRDLGYGFRSNQKQVEGVKPESAQRRDAQFGNITALRAEFTTAGLPILSLDTKKKEHVGTFKNAGQEWCQAPQRVNLHDFPQAASALAVPYGIYDVTRNRGTVYVGTSADTAEFAVAAVRRWWEEEGRRAYPGARRVLLLVDSGGSNGYRSRLWKQQLQEKLCNGLGLEVVVCHYPPGCSKWNPVEHRLFSQISINWAAQPLRDLTTMLQLIRGTTTSTGLRVRARLLLRKFATGIKISNRVMRQINLVRAAICPDWCYTIKPLQQLTAPA